MSYKDQLSDLDRDGERSLTQQLVDLVTEAISSGELAPGEQLPPTRELAELAGVNHLTAVRAYKRLRELGLVSSQVGRGTFVRGAARDRRRAPGQRLDRLAALRAARRRGDLRRPGARRDAPPGDQRGPGARSRSATRPSACSRSSRDPRGRRPTVREQPERALQYSDVQGLPELADAARQALGRPRRARGPRRHPDHQRRQPGARAGARAILRPGDAVACEDPSFTVGDPPDATSPTCACRRPDRRGRARRRRARGAAGAQRDPPARDPAAPPQPDRARPLAGAARAPARARPPPRVLHLEDGIYGDLRFEGDEVRARCAPRRPRT